MVQIDSKVDKFKIDLNWIEIRIENPINMI